MSFCRHYIFLFFLKDRFTFETIFPWWFIIHIFIDRIPIDWSIKRLLINKLWIWFFIVVCWWEFAVLKIIHWYTDQRQFNEDCKRLYNFRISLQIFMTTHYTAILKEKKYILVNFSCAAYLMHLELNKNAKLYHWAPLA